MLVLGGTVAPGEAAVGEEVVRVKTKVDEELRQMWRRRWGFDAKTGKAVAGESLAGEGWGRDRGIKKKKKKAEVGSRRGG